MTMLDAALAYAARGLYIFPCDEQGKEPHLTGGTNPKTGKPYRFQWGKYATNDPARIKQLWQQWPDANIGLPAKPNRLIVIDPDAPKTAGDPDGVSTWVNLTAELDIPDTLTQNTPHYGAHVFFKRPDGVIIGNHDLAPGVNVRGVKGDGGYVVITPSRLADGAYTWAYGCGPDEIEIAPLPQALIDRLTTPKREPKPTREPTTYTLADDITRAAVNLKRLSKARADDYQTWIEVGLALCDLGEAGKSLWLDWSKQSGKFDENVCFEKWGTFKRGAAGDQVTLASLSYWADQDDPSGKARASERSNGNGQRPAVIETLAPDVGDLPAGPMPELPTDDQTLADRPTDADPWRMFTLADAYTPREPLRFIVAALLTLPCLAIVYGAPGTLKSMLLVP